MQLAHPRRGWENEHLATFLLSRVAFVASPITVADDIGTDVFCTLFERDAHNGQPVLLPRSSIAVQVKSGDDAVDVTGKLDYLERLEVPYYLGVVHQEALTLELFSARYLPVLFSAKGRPPRLLLKPIEKFERQYRPEDEAGSCTLLCHKVATLNAHDDAAAIEGCAVRIREDATAALQIIASRLNQEYVFEIISGEVEIFAGRGSAQTFRHAFFKRLAEAYFNLSFLSDAGRPASEAEMDAFDEVASVLARAGPVPDHVLRLREGLRKRRREREA